MFEGEAQARRTTGREHSLPFLGLEGGSKLKSTCNVDLGRAAFDREAHVLSLGHHKIVAPSVTSASQQADDVNRVTKDLFIGNRVIASSLGELKALGITFVINCARELPNPFVGQMRYLSLGLSDTPSQDIFAVLEPSYRYAKNVIRRGGKVLVHCAAGISRSASICIYFLMRENKWSYEQALAYLKRTRPIVNPNSGFETQLKDAANILRDFA